MVVASSEIILQAHPQGGMLLAALLQCGTSEVSLLCTLAGTSLLRARQGVKGLTVGLLSHVLDQHLVLLGCANGCCNIHFSAESLVPLRAARSLLSKRAQPHLLVARSSSKWALAFRLHQSHLFNQLTQLQWVK